MITWSLGSEKGFFLCLYLNWWFLRDKICEVDVVNSLRSAISVLNFVGQKLLQPLFASRGLKDQQ